MAEVKKRGTTKKGNGLSSPLNHGLENPCPVDPLRNDVRYVSTEIGRLPKSWTVCRFDAIFSVQQGKQVSKSKRAGDNQCAFLRTKNVYWGKLDLSELDKMHFSDNETERLALKLGDLLVCEGGSIGRTAIWNGEVKNCYYQNHLLRARLINKNVADPQFMLYWLWYAFEMGKVYFGRGNVTTIPNLASSKLCELPIPIPPLPEQHEIAAILGQVQKAIEEQEKILALTAELKRTLLHQLFTRGLRNEPQKQTDIGPIPKSWEVVPLGELVNFQTGKLNSNAARKDGQYPFFTCSQETFWINQYAFDTEAILLSGNNAQGNYSVKHYSGKFNAYQRTYVITVKTTAMLPYSFLLYSLSRNLERLKTLSIGTATKYLTLGMLQSLPMPKPSFEEARCIGQKLCVIEDKQQQVSKRVGLLNDLFRTLLQQLMTRQITCSNISQRLEVYYEQ